MSGRLGFAAATHSYCFDIENASTLVVDPLTCPQKWAKRHNLNIGGKNAMSFMLLNGSVGVGKK